LRHWQPKASISQSPVPSMTPKTRPLDRKQIAELVDVFELDPVEGRD
jgi:hypothetical protein